MESRTGDAGFSDFSIEMEDFSVRKTKTFERHSKVTYGGSIVNGPLIYDGIAYFGACDSNVYAVDAETGEEIWRFRTGGIIFESSAIIHEGRLYIGSYDGHLYSISLDGKLAWRFRTGGEIACGACADGGLVYFGSRDGFAYCLEAGSGKLVWKFKTGGEIDSTPSVEGKKLFVASFDGYLYCLDKDTGNNIWRFRAGEEIYNATKFPVEKNRIYFSCFDNYLYCLETGTGKELWRFRTGKYGNSASPVVHNDVVYVPTRDGVLYALDMDGKLIWRFRAGENVGPLSVSGGMVCIGSCDNNLYALDMEGREIWRFRTTDYVWSEPASWKGRVYVGAWDCHLYCLSRDRGKKIWAFRTSTMVRSKIPPFREGFEAEIKTRDDRTEEDGVERYEINLAAVSDEYGTESEYVFKSEYTTESDYK